MTHLGPAPSRSRSTHLLTAVPYSHPEARRLTRALHTEQTAIYGFADDPDDTPREAFTPPRGLFVIAHRAHVPEAVGCGGWRLLDPETAEIKRMYVAVSARGGGLGLHILEHLEEQAAACGVKRLVLETGVRNEAALALYRRCGYGPSPSYVPGRDMAINRAMSKKLPCSA
ncbi:GNAT family N-acetyltransferase [Streptomyces sp. HK10]|uniref:GNAT family N-acetyltransferase n=1 Tax=Streptomyces sp. HK10 TaxID=3373255 RepID=UPI003748B570